MNKPITKIKHNFEKLEFYISKLLNRRCHNSRGLVVLVASAHKVGSTWLFKLVADLGNFRKISPPAKFRETGTLIIDKIDLSFYFNFLFGRCIFKSHSNPAPFEFNSNIKIVSIFRDPRDVIVSNIFYLDRLEPELGGWGPKFRDFSITQKIRHFIEHGEFSISKIEQWYNYQNCFQVRYENLLKDPRFEMQRLLQWIGIAVSKTHLEKTIQDLSFAKMKNSKPDRSWFFRKGVSSDWKNNFDPACVEQFKTAKNGRWNNLLFKMGYETDCNWTV